MASDNTNEQPRLKVAGACTPTNPLDGIALIEFADLRLDPNTLKLRGPRGETSISLQQFKFLIALLGRIGWKASKEDMARDAWGHQQLNRTDAYRKCVKRLARQFLELGSIVKISMSKGVCALVATPAPALPEFGQQCPPRPARH